MADLDKEFVEYVVKALVTQPDAVVVNRSVDDMGVLLELTVDPADMGKVIGKAGATAKSIRTLLRVLGAKNDARVNLKIVEPEGVNVPAEAAAEPAPEEGAPLEAAPVEAAPAEVPMEQPSAEPVVEAPIAPAEEDRTDVHQQTRDELAELADLDI
jgi:predicted RNA-binding protein YlqC (UPF0109 family)